ncbi:MAG: hypothetical protein AAGA32_10060 [Pseudomonadota bacterium]
MRDTGSVLPIAAILALAVGVAWWLFSDTERPLHSSAVGLSGLEMWLDAEDVPIVTLRGLPVEADRVGLRLLPLYDTDLYRRFEAPEDRVAYMKTGTELDIDQYIANTKIERAPTLVVAPKWMRAMRHLGVAHETLLLPLTEVARPLRQLDLDVARIERSSTHLVEVNAGDGTVTLYAPQMFAPALAPPCRSLIGDRRGHLLVACDRRDGPVWILSDPDLLNNHGLSLGENGAVAVRVLADLAGDGLVFVDTVADLVLEPEPPVEPRNWSDLARFFAYPFSLLWIGAAVALAILLWRGGLRTTPPVRLFLDGLGASKAVSITAKARLLRSTGHDVPVLTGHVEARLAWLDAVLHGRGVPGEAPRTRLLRRLRRHAPERAEAFDRAASAALTAATTASPGELTALARTFETETQKVLDELGRPTRER